MMEGGEQGKCRESDYVEGIQQIVAMWLLPHTLSFLLHPPARKLSAITTLLSGKGQAQHSVTHVHSLITESQEKRKNRNTDVRTHAKPGLRMLYSLYAALLIPSSHPSLKSVYALSVLCVDSLSSHNPLCTLCWLITQTIWSEAGITRTPAAETTSSHPCRCSNGKAQTRQKSCPSRVQQPSTHHLLPRKDIPGEWQGPWLPCLVIIITTEAQLKQSQAWRSSRMLVAPRRNQATAFLFPEAPVPLKDEGQADEEQVPLSPSLHRRAGYLSHFCPSRTTPLINGFSFW